MGDWKDYKIGDIILNIADGGTPSRHNPANFGEDVNWIVISDIKDEIYDTKEKLSREGFIRCSSLLWKPGSIILSTGATIGEVGITRVHAATKQGISGIEVNKSLVQSEYLKYWFQHNRDKIKSLAQGSTIKEIRPTTIVKIPIRIPKSLQEQMTIATILVSIDHSIKKVEQLIAKNERIKIGLMQDFLTRGIDEQGNIRNEKTHEFKDSVLGRIPMDWEVEKLHSLSNISSGVTLGKKHEGESTMLLPYLRVANVQDGYLDLKDVAQIRIPKSNIPKYQLQLGDVLMNEGGDFDKLGRGSVWEDQIPNCLHQNHVFKVRCNLQLLNPYFLALYSESPFGKKFFMLNSKQSTNLASINSSQLKKFPIPKPGIEEQNRIIEIIKKQKVIIEKYQNDLQKLQCIKDGLMQDLLTGKVRVDNLKIYHSKTINK